MILRDISFLGLAAVAFMATSAAVSMDQICPGQVWLDAAGRPIQAHGGGTLLHSNVYYWFGEDRTPGSKTAVACYSSTNLLIWKQEDAALCVKDLPRIDGRKTFVERPKVIFNPRTGKFVMWVHLEQDGYRFSQAGVAISDRAAGPYKFLKAMRPIANSNDFVSLKEDPEGQKKAGGTFRDMNLFVDVDGKAYAFYSSEGNWTMYVVRLNDEFTGPELPAVENTNWAKILGQRMREAPAPFKWRGRYYLITSGCTGWTPNAAEYAVASQVLGPYQTLGNPCVGTGSDKTFDSQSSFVLPHPSDPDCFILMADRWNPKDLNESRYVWLPFTMETNGTFAISWRDCWNLSAPTPGNATLSNH